MKQGTSRLSGLWRLGTERQLSQGAKREITLEEDDPRMVGLMIDYFYYLDYQTPPDEQVSPTNTDHLQNGEVVEASPVERAPSIVDSRREPSEGRLHRRTSRVLEQVAWLESGGAFPPAEEEASAAPGDFGACVDDDRAAVATTERPEDLEIWSSSPKKRKESKKKASRSIAGLRAGWSSKSGATNGDKFESEAEFDPPPVPKPPTDVAAVSNSATTATGPTGLSTHAQMYALAEKYAVEGLKELARKKYRKAVDDHWASPEFAPSIGIAYKTTGRADRGLRDIVIDAILSHRTLRQTREIRATCRENHDLCGDLLEETWVRQALI